MRPRPQAGAKSRGHRFQGRNRVAKSLSDIGERLVIKEVSAKSLVLAMKRPLRLEEESSARPVIHDAGSLELIIFRAKSELGEYTKVGTG